MGGSLESVQLKLVRAKEHLEAILKVLDEYEYGDCEIIPEEDPETKLGVLRVRLPDPPPELKPIISDFFFNVRSALDYLIAQLVIANGGTPDRSNSFPIAGDSVEFADAIRRGRLKGVSPKAQAVVEALQPYPGRDEILATLNHLHNPDKHRDFALTTAVAHDTHVEWSGAGGAFLEMFFGDEELRNGAAFGDIAVDFSALAADGEFPHFPERFRNMQVKGEAAIFVAFEDSTADELEPWRVDSVLNEILEFARDTVIPAFQPFFN